MKESLVLKMALVNGEWSKKMKLSRNDEDTFKDVLIEIANQKEPSAALQAVKRAIKVIFVEKRDPIRVAVEALEGLLNGKKGDARCFWFLGRCYQNGIGVT